jgi:DNA-binding SARP family transcriptional activator
MMDPAAVHIGLLGGFVLRRGHDVLHVGLTAQRLAAVLALHRRPLQRLFVAGLLWADSPESHAYSSLRTALWRLRRSGVDVVDTANGQITLSASVDVDVDAATARARRVLAGDARTHDLEAICGEGDLLPDWYDDWIVIERERLRQLRLHALESLCASEAARGRFGHAAEAGLAAVACEPLRESAHRAVIAAHLAEDNHVEAVRQYRLFRELLTRHVGVEPSPQMRRLVEGAWGDAPVTSQ